MSLVFEPPYRGLDRHCKPAVGAAAALPGAVSSTLALDLSIICDLTRKFAPGREIIDFSLSLVDGRALPDRFELSGNILAIKSGSFDGLVLRMDLVYADGHVGRFEISMDQTAEPMKLKLRQIEVRQQPYIFTSLLSNDEPVERMPLPTVA